MTHLEKGLHDHFARLQNTPGATTNGTSVPPTASVSITDNSIADAGTLGTPFAKVNTVESGSPADQAGLKIGDTIRGFGSVQWLNHERLSKVAEVVQQNEGVSSDSLSFFCYVGYQANCPTSDPSRSKWRGRTRVDRARPSWICSSPRGAIGEVGGCWGAI